MADCSLRCPSSTCTVGSAILGIRMPDGRYAFLSKPIPLTPALVDAAQHGPRSPEKRLRFTGPCVQAACAQWTGSRCGVIDNVLGTQDDASIGNANAGESLRPCAIREKCRWFDQAGPAACTVCPEVATDNS